MAGVAIPATIVGVPIWIGRQIRSKLKKNHNLTKKKRRALVGLGSTVALLLSPLVAGITGSYRLLYTLCLYYSLVGVGVPVVLLYVYGVIPITLCRTGTYSFFVFRFDINLTLFKADVELQCLLTLHFDSTFVRTIHKLQIPMATKLRNQISKLQPISILHRTFDG